MNGKENKREKGRKYLKKYTVDTREWYVNRDTRQPLNFHLSRRIRTEGKPSIEVTCVRSSTGERRERRKTGKSNQRSSTK